ncbi:Rap1a/Tai family immunity protein [Pseudomonas fluorescens]|uniref:Rap1a/Tai family immunity protein n=1 Tax=Pseudomonas fluorescens TaxID=294 RepID=UPI003250AF2F
MKAWIGAVALAGLMASGHAMALGNGSELASMCRSSIQQVTTFKSDDPIGAGRCFGLIEGTVATVLMVDTQNKAQPRFCLPKNVNTLQMMKVVVKYLDDNPALLNLNEPSLILRAVVDAWPCSR